MVGVIIIIFNKNPKSAGRLTPPGVRGRRGCMGVPGRLAITVPRRIGVRVRTRPGLC